MRRPSARWLGRLKRPGWPVLAPAVLALLAGGGLVSVYLSARPVRPEARSWHPPALATPAVAPVKSKGRYRNLFELTQGPSQTAAGASSSASQPPAPPKPVYEPMGLVGILSRDGKAVARLQVKKRLGKEEEVVEERLRVGDAVGAWKVSRIESDRVVLKDAKAQEQVVKVFPLGVTKVPAAVPAAEAPKAKR